MEYQNKQNTHGTGDDGRLLDFDPIVVVRDVLKRWLVILLAAIMVGVGTYIATDICYVPSYTATTTYVVTSRSSSSRIRFSSSRFLAKWW